MAQKQVVGAQEHRRLRRALISLEGLAVGDAFGQRILSDSSEQAHRLLETRLLPETRHGSWPYTGTTQMALSLVEVLRSFHALDPNLFMTSVVRHYEAGRTYAADMHALLRALQQSIPSSHQGASNTAVAQEDQAEALRQNHEQYRTSPWDEAITALPGKQGLSAPSTAMPVALLGAYFADNSERVVTQARLAATILHAQSEAVAGAIAVATAAALVW